MRGWLLEGRRLRAVAALGSWVFVVLLAFAVPAGAEPSGPSVEPSVSGDGRYVAFRSAASNLVSADTNGAEDIFVADRVTRQATRVSVSSAGVEANGSSFRPSVSRDGRYVAFRSAASNLVSGDTNGTEDIFVADRVGGQTVRVSVGPSGGEANGSSYEPSISADGRFVAFRSSASNLVSGDGNGVADVFVADRVAGQVARVSLSSSGGEGNGLSAEPSVSADGTYVAFRSDASNLVSGDGNGAADVFVADRVSGQVARVSVTSAGGEVGGSSSEPSVSADGRFVAFTSGADFAGSGDANGRRDVYVRDRTLGRTVWASAGGSGSGDSRSPSLSGDGAFVAFASEARLQSSDTNGVSDVYERELATSFVARLSFDDDLPQGNGASEAPSLSADATYGAFASEASNLVVGDSGGFKDVFVHTWSADGGTTTTTSRMDTAGRLAPRSSSGSTAGCAGGGSGTSEASRSASVSGSSVLTAASLRTGQRCDVERMYMALSSAVGCEGGDLAVDATACQSDPVNSATGSYTAQVRDLALPGIGLAFALVRSYDSGDSTVGPLGRGWTHSYAASLSIRDGGALVVARGQGGQPLNFSRLADGSYAPAPGGRATLTLSGGVYELVRGDQVRYRFDGSGRLTGMVERNGRGLSLSYTDGRLSVITDTAGRTIALSYSNGLLSGVSLPDGRRVSYGYTGGLLSSVTDVRGGVTRYEYVGGRLAKVIDQNGRVQIENVYAPDGRVSAQTDALGKRTTFSWDAQAQTSTVRDPRGYEWRDVYAGFALVRQVDPLGHERSYTYDADLNVIAVRDPLGRRSAMTYDRRGNLLSHTDPLGQSRGFTYNARNDPITSTDGRGQTSTYGYDGAGNLVSVTEPGTVVTRFGRDPAGTGLLTSVTDPRGKTETFSYDGTGNLVKVTSPLGFEQTFSYDGSGRLVGAVDPRGNRPGANRADYETRFGYDAGDHRISVTDPLGNQTRSVFDAAGRTTRQTDAKGRSRDLGYDAANRLVSVTAPDAGTTSYRYDDTGQLIGRTDANGRVTTYGYDPARRLTSQTLPSGRRSVYGYDAASNLIASTDPAQRTTTFSFDAADRLTGVNYPDGTPDVSYGYDTNSNRVSMDDGEGRALYTYDALDRLTGVARGSRAFAYGYDPAGNVIQRRYPDGRAVDYAYDDDGRLGTVTSAQKTTTYTYDPAAQLTATTLPNGFEETRGYDRAGRVTEVKNARGATVLSRFSYTLDQTGNPILVQSPTATVSYAYDGQDRLTEACYQQGGCAEPDPDPCPTTHFVTPLGPTLGSKAATNRFDPCMPPTTNRPAAIRQAAAASTDPYIRYGYDAVGNRTSEVRPAGTTTYSFDSDDQLSAQFGPQGSTTYDHDANGNQTRAGAQTFGYDLAGRLTAAATGSATTTYRYDGDGQRTQSVTGAQTTRMTWDQNAGVSLLVAEDNAAGDPLRRYLYGDQLISMTAGVAEHYYQRDALGSISDLTAADGTPEWSYAYDPYGNARRADRLTTAAPENPIGFAGEQKDPDTGLYHLRARDYDPQTARFTTTDPIPTPGSAYAYANNQPTTLTDPTGLSPFNGLSSLSDLANKIVNGVADATGCAANSLTLGAPDLVAGQLGLGDLTPEKSTACDIGSGGGDIAGLFIPGLDILKAGQLGARGARALPRIAGGARGAGGRASKLGPDPNAGGPYSRFARDQSGRISKYTTFDGSGNEVLRFRGSGRSHGPFDPPIVLEPPRGKGPGARPNRARKPTADELPNGY